MPYKFVKIGKSGMSHFMSLIRILEELRPHYLLDLLGIKSSGFLSIFLVRVNKASERHGIGKKDRFGYQFG